MNELGIGRFMILFDWFMNGGLEKTTVALDSLRDQKARRVFVAPSE
jgi:hypothetical protein